MSPLYFQQIRRRCFRLLNIWHLICTTTHKFLTLKNTANISSSSLLQTGNNIEVFILLPLLHKYQNRLNIKRFFQKHLHKIDQHIEQQPVFLDKETALKFTHFIDNRFGILHALVPETAIQGKNGELIVKPGILSDRHIQGCYLTTSIGKQYIANPIATI